MLPGFTPSMFPRSAVAARRRMLLDTVGAFDWIVQDDWNNLDNTVECIGGGAGGLGGTNAQSGGGGGAYAKSVNLSLTLGATIKCNVGAGGPGSGSTTGSPGGDTWFNSVAFPTTGQACGAKGSPAAIRNAVSPGGGVVYNTGTGSTGYAGGSGAAGADTTQNSGSGGGGAGGPRGPGLNGATIAGGGGGHSGGTVGNASAGAGGQNYQGVGGGAAGGGAGSLGGGGGGGSNAAGFAVAGGAGGDGFDIADSFGCGGGGGGAGVSSTVSTAQVGGKGGKYGGGGGGGGQRISGTGMGGAGGKGGIFLNYGVFVTPDVPQTKLLLHMDGPSNGYATFTDASLNTHGVADVFGNTNATDVQFKLGTRSAAFDGTGDYLTFPHHTDWNLGVLNWTIDFWIRPTTVPSNMALFCRPQNGTNYATRTFLGYLNVNNSFQFDSYIDAGNNVVNVGTPNGAVPNGVWTHIAIVRYNYSTQIYVNGVASGAPDTRVTTMPAITGPLVIGALDTVGNWTFNGHMDEFRISHDARWTSNFTPPTAPHKPLLQLPVIGAPTTTDKKILLHFDGSNGSTSMIDSASAVYDNGTHTWTASNGAALTTPSPKFGTACLDTNTDSKFIATPAHADFNIGAQNFTLDCWAKGTDPADGSSHFLAVYGNTTANQVAFRFGIDSSGMWQFRATANGSTDFVTLTASEGPNGSWQHVAVTREANTWRLFVGGVQKATHPTSGTIYVPIGSFHVGGNSQDGTDFWPGQIDEFRLIRGTCLWTANFTPPTAPGTADP